ncbi:Uncharacterised protein [Phocoenobacter uteri]|uniref:DUF6378 domain-containing protein n=1 Tax=Phocoenobacter uteri TaxID=146806 RepID=A0A379C9Y6_9PAST|nr:DUF6378 domain-containing protein [Phocoenobacter uteri]MDG6881081.1 hypothetical protein [Phocoenobacter uteri]SUB59103.1 Uncharacterised protein [Phocoenobacter uteri]SUB76452.1 Uncharacterised protein [Phocoenobacter uteri]
MENQTVQQTIKERGAVYGDFGLYAQIAQELKGIIYLYGENLDGHQLEALEMMCVKIGRILSGDPNYDDSWKDIAGYAILGGNLDKGNDDE